MKPRLPLNLDHSCWRRPPTFEDGKHYPAYYYSEQRGGTPYPTRGADPDETKCPACQWLAGYEAATKEKGDSE